MTALVKRVFTYDSDDDSFIEDYLFAIVADNNTCHYVFATGAEISGLDDDRIKDLTELYGSGKTLTAKDRINIASTNIFGMGFDGPKYKNIEDAIAEEKSMLDKAREARDELNDDYDSVEYDPEDDDLMVD